MNKFLIIVPVFNEESTVKAVANRTLEICKDFADILFVNDGSTDASSKILQKIVSGNSSLHFIDKKHNEGYGASLISGINFGIEFEYEYLITMDCDEQHQPTDLHRFHDFDLSIDLVSGSRYLPDSKAHGIRPPVDRVEINHRITSLVNNKYRWNLSDTFCGFKRYKTSSFLNHGFIHKGYASPMELWSYIKFAGLSICEIYVDKIYITDDRSFGEDLNKKRKRYKYYLEIWKESHERYFSKKLNFLQESV
jgi:dolichol-phosphate mannosyltransferase